MIESTYLFSYSIHSMIEDNEWTEELRNQFFLRPDVKIPKSVDHNVWWPEYGMWDFFDVGVLQRVNNRDKSNFINASGYTPSNKNNTLLTAYIISEDNLEEQAYFKSTPGLDDFFIGYEVIEDAATSTMSNCGYINMEEYRDRFAKYVNEHGLFEELEIAKEFGKFNYFKESEQFVIALYLDKRPL